MYLLQEPLGKDIVTEEIWYRVLVKHLSQVWNISLVFQAKNQIWFRLSFYLIYLARGDWPALSNLFKFGCYNVATE